MPTISLFKNIFETKNGVSLDIDDFLENIKNGYWQDIVLPIRAIRDEDARREAKKLVPYVTLSGEFSERADDAIIRHSGFIGIDIDDTDPEETKSLINCDPYVYGTFTSISGLGLCAVFIIDGKRHREAHAGIAEYLYNTYNLVIDPTSVNPSRARFVSFDPHLWINEKAKPFTQYPKKVKEVKQENIVFSHSDFNDLINQLQVRNINLVESYHDWIRIGFAFASKFGESGRDYFHAVSRQSGKYDSKTCDRQYNNCIKGSAGSNKRAFIATFYYQCKQAGLTLYSDKTKLIAQAAQAGKLSKKPVEQVVNELAEIDNIQDSEKLVEQIYNTGIYFKTDDTLFGQLEQWLRHNYKLRRNIITRYIEHEGQILKQKDLNSIYIAANKVFTKAKYENIERLINSDFTPDYNPILEFIEANKSREPSGLIDALFDCIENDDKIFTRYLGKKWLVSIMSAIHGVHSPLMLVLSGDIQGTGKTEFIRRLLPRELMPYYAESKLDAGKDDEILMTQKLLIMDDEMGGKSKKDERRLKELLSRQTFSLREPYGKNNVDLNRLAVLSGTTNDRHILNDPTGNRRILPIHVDTINQEKYNSINKIDLFIEAYKLYVNGFDWQLSKEDIKRLRIHGGEFETYDAEYELILKYFEVPDEANKDHIRLQINMTATEIKVELERSSLQKLSLIKLGKELQRIGFKQVILKDDRKTKRVYSVLKVESVTDGYREKIDAVTAKNGNGLIF